MTYMDLPEGRKDWLPSTDMKLKCEEVDKSMGGFVQQLL